VTGQPRAADRPRFLYRYYSNHKFILDVVKRRRLYHAAPTEFNDPFDCRPMISLLHSHCNDDRTWWKLLYYLARMQCEIDGQPASDATKHADAAFRNGLHRNHEWLRDVESQLRKMDRLVRVCCFSRTPRNVMMWAHYAGRHAGVVFQFKTTCLKDAASHTWRGYAVSYSSRALDVGEYVRALEAGFDHNMPQEMGRIIYARKGREWRAEEEVRFFTDQAQKYSTFPEQALYGIIFGSSCPDNLVGQIFDAIASWGCMPRMFRVSIADSSHKLCIRTLGPCANPRAGKI
jgi:hypothetical protein